MGGPGRGMMPGEKPKDFKNSIEKLVRYLGRYWYAIVAVMIFAAGGVYRLFRCRTKGYGTCNECIGGRSRKKDRGNRIY